jgi:hypothetical protein
MRRFRILEIPVPPPDSWSRIELQKSGLSYICSAKQNSPAAMASATMPMSKSWITLPSALAANDRPQLRRTTSN